MMNVSLFFNKKSKPQLPFIITMKTTTASESITIPIKGTTNNYRVDWGDGTVTTGHTETATHVYITAGTYDVKIIGTFLHMAFLSTSEALKVIYIKQWGSNKWVSMDLAFWECSLLNIIATDKPDLSNCVSMVNTFRACTSLNASFSHWDTSNIKNITGTFRACRSMKFGFPGWNVSNITAGNDFCSGIVLATSEYDATLIAWSSQTLKTGVSIHFGGSKYSSGAAATARALIISKGWTITDGGMV